MRGAATYLALAGVVLMLAAGCRTMTGQSLGRNIDDKTTTAGVKTKLAEADLRNLTWVDVDTTKGTVYLHGTTMTAGDRDRASKIARSVPGVQRVVNNIQVRPKAAMAANAGPEAASPQGPAPAGGAPAASPATTGFEGTHTMTGNVVAVDHTTGHLTLDTGEGPLMLHFPPPALSQVQRGDQVTVELAIKPAR